MTRVAIVTGSDSGIGKASAVALARAGCDVGITWHEDKDGVEETAAEVRALGRRAQVRRLDLTQLPDAAEVIDELADALGGVDVLVNNAGSGTSSPFVETSYDDWRRVLSIDLDGAFLCGQRAARRMLAQVGAAASSTSRASTSTSRRWVPRRTAPPRAASAC